MVKFVWQISYPPVNGASLGSYFCFKNGFYGQKQAKWGQSKQLWHPNLHTFFDEVIDRQTDRQIL